MRDRSEMTLRNQRDFTRIYKQGKSKGSRYAVILYKNNGLDRTRTAFVSSRKVGNSVERNRSRRLMREAYRAMAPNISSGYDIIFVARNNINGCREQEVEKCLRKALCDCGLLTDNNIAGKTGRKKNAEGAVKHKKAGSEKQKKLKDSGIPENDKQ